MRVYCYNKSMLKSKSKIIYHGERQIPLLVEKGEDGFYVVECPILKGCYTQGKTIDEALRNIREVIDLILEEKENKMILKNYRPVELSLHTITV